MCVCVCLYFYIYIIHKMGGICNLFESALLCVNLFGFTKDYHNIYTYTHISLVVCVYVCMIYTAHLLGWPTRTWCSLPAGIGNYIRATSRPSDTVIVCVGCVCDRRCFRCVVYVVFDCDRVHVCVSIARASFRTVSEFMFGNNIRTRIYKRGKENYDNILH